jgi:hypothetical protein
LPPLANKRALTLKIIRDSFFAFVAKDNDIVTQLTKRFGLMPAVFRDPALAPGIKNKDFHNDLRLAAARTAFGFYGSNERLKISRK